MAEHLIDSDVIIWALRSREGELDLLDRLSSNEVLSCSAINVLEVEQGARPSELRTIQEFLAAYNVLPLNALIARKAAEWLRSAGRKGHRGEWADAAIAATALVHGLTLVTHNLRHYQYPGLSLYPINA